MSNLREAAQHAHVVLHGRQRLCLRGTLVIDPKSTAGVLLREHDDAHQALRYAERKAAALLAMHNAIGLDYAQAAEDLREHLRNCIPQRDYGPKWATFAA